MVLIAWRLKPKIRAQTYVLAVIEHTTRRVRILGQSKPVVVGRATIGRDGAKVPDQI